MALDKMLYDEIHAAIHAMLKESFDTELFWTSVGLLDEGNTIKWKSHVNHKYVGEPCKGKSNFESCPPAEIVTENWPSCPLDKKSIGCDFRKNIMELEANTMLDGSLSMGEVSKSYFKAKKGEHPYISMSEIVCGNYPWIKYKEVLVGEIENNLVIDSPNKETYKASAEKSMKASVSALVPLVQSHGGKLNYVGAIVLCAQANSEIWEHLPRVKAVALPLIDAHRHVIGMTPDEVENKIQMLLRALLERPFKEHLYSNFKRDQDEVTWHTHQPADIVEGIEKLLKPSADNADWQNASLSKGLFNYLSDFTVIANWRRIGEKRSVSIEELKRFLEAHFNMKVCFNCEVFQWPTQPGLITLISLIHVYRALHEKDDSELGVKEIKVSVDGNQQIVWSFLLKSDSSNLQARFFQKTFDPGHHGNVAGRILNATFGDLSEYISVFDEFKNSNTMFMPLLQKSNEPIFQIFFGETTFNIRWSL